MFYLKQGNGREKRDDYGKASGSRHKISTKLFACLLSAFVIVGTFGFVFATTPSSYGGEEPIAQEEESSVEGETEELTDEDGNPPVTPDGNQSSSVMALGEDVVGTLEDDGHKKVFVIDAAVTQTTVTPGQMVRFDLEFKWNPDQDDHLTTLYTDEYVIYVLKDFATNNIDPIADYYNNNSSNPRVFTFTNNGDHIIDGVTYTKITAKVNSELQGVLAQNENLVSGWVRIELYTSTVYVNETNIVPVIVEDSSGVTFDPITVNPPETVKDSLTVEKGVSAIYRPNGDGTYTAAESPESTAIRQGDIVVFSIRARATSGTPTISLLEERLPNGYTAIPSTSTILTLPYSTVDVGNTGWVSNSSGNTSTYKSYIKTLDPQITLDASNAEKRDHYEYFAAAVTGNPGSDADSTFTNNVRVTWEGPNGSGVPGGGVTPPLSETYDLGTQVAWYAIYRDGGQDTGGTQIRKANTDTIFGSVHVPNIFKDDYVYPAFRVFNQGSINVTEVTVRMYLPKGYEFDETYTYGKQWKKIGTVTNDPNSNWGDLTAYEMTTPVGQVIYGGKNSYGTNLDFVGFTEYVPQLKVLTKANGDYFDPIDYYIATEIVSFKDETGLSVDGDLDVDSYPDTDPFNDLYDNRTYYPEHNRSGTFYPIDAQAKNPNDSSLFKERDFGWDQQAKGGTNLEDEDDFDFIRANIGNTAAEEADVFEKRRMTTKYPTNYAGNQLDRWDYGRDLALNNWRYSTDLQNYVYLGDDGQLQQTKTFFVYRMTINAGGREDMKDVVLTDQLPEGLKFVEYDYRTSAGESNSTQTKGIGVRFAYNVPLVDEGNDSLAMSYDSVLTSYLYSHIIRLNTNNYTGKFNETAGIKQAAAEGSATYNPKMNSYAENMSVTWGEDMTSVSVGFDRIYHSEVYVYLAVEVDTSKMDYSQVYKNSSVLTYNSERVTSTEENEISWEIANGSAYVRKQIETPAFVIESGDDKGKLETEYKIRVRYNGTGTSPENWMGANGIVDNPALSGSLPTGTKVDSVEVTDVEGYQGNITDGWDANGDLAGNPTKLDTDTLISVTNTDNVVTIKDKTTVEPYTVFYVTLKVVYDDWMHGSKIDNVAGGSKVTQQLPLNLTVEKQDKTSSTLIGGVEFEAYYGPYAETGPNKPVVDLAGVPIVITTSVSDGKASFEFLPEDYLTENTWKIVLVETDAPEPYKGNIGKKIILTVKKDSSGNLSFIDDLEDANDVKPTNGNVTDTLVVENESESTPPEIDTSAGPFSLEPRSGLVTLEDTSDLNHIAVGTDGMVRITDIVSYSGLVAGQRYTLVGKLMYTDGTVASEFTVGGNPVVSVPTSFTARSGGMGNTRVQFVFNVNDLSEGEEIYGKALVVYEKLYEGDLTGNDVVIGTDGNVTTASGDTVSPIKTHEAADDRSQTVIIAGLETLAYEGYNEEDKAITADANATITDKVSFDGLCADREYVLTGILVDESTWVNEDLWFPISDRVTVNFTIDSTDGKIYAVENGIVSTTVIGQATVTNPTLGLYKGDVTTSFTVDASELSGKSIVVFEMLEDEEGDVAFHMDINDADQTIGVEYEPISTTLSASKTATGTGAPTTWSFNFGLFGYTDNENSTDLTGIGSKIGSDAVATNTSPTVNFTTETYTATGDYYYVIQETSAGGGGWSVDDATYLAKVAVTDSGGAISAAVSYFKWDAAGNEWDSVTASDVKFANTYVPIEIGTTATDANDGDKYVALDENGNISITDTVSYENLLPNTTYTLIGKLVYTNGDDVLDADGNPVVAYEVFTTDAAEAPATTIDGMVDMDFIFDASGLDLAGKGIVVFEKLYRGDLTDEGYDLEEDGYEPTDKNEELFTPIATHEDPEDEGQTVYVPEITTDAYEGDDDEDNIVNPVENITVTDNVSFKGLLAKKEYVLNGELHIKNSDGSDGGILDDGNGDVTATITFTITGDGDIIVGEKKIGEAALDEDTGTYSGYVLMDFTFDASALAGETLVVFEELFHDDISIAIHADIEDEGQSIDVSEYDAALRKWVSDVNNVIGDGDAGTVAPSDLLTSIAQAEAGKSSGPVSVTLDDYVTYTIRIFNQSAWPLKVPKVIDDLPAGLDFITEDVNSAAINAGWAVVHSADLDQDILVYEYADTDSVPILQPSRNVDGTSINSDGSYSDTMFTDITLILRVNSKATSDNLLNTAEIAVLTDEDDVEVPDIDSIPDDDPYNDETKDNEIEEHGRDKDGNENGGKDEDDNDIADLIFVKPIISVEVDKDTIKRTSAAFVSLPGKEGFNNVGAEDEHYRYDFDFRSTSNTDADEFVVDDPLEAVKLGQIHVEGLWTPTVWGDKDGVFNVWYKTKNGSGNSATQGKKVTNVDNPVFPTNASDGWKLWTQVDQSATFEANGGVINRLRLGLPAGLADGDYITAIRFEFGAVKVGFTSKNYDDTNMNGPAGDGNASGYRNSNGAAGYLDQLEAAPAPAVDNTIETDSLSLFTPFGLISALADILPLADNEPTAPAKGVTNNWTPDETRPDYSEELAGLTGDGLRLKPASYLVSAAQPMSNEAIVSSVSASIARGTVSDQDRDAVLTLEITTFEANANNTDPSGIVEENSFLRHAEENGLTFRNGVWYDRNGVPVTGDAMALNLWAVMMLAALVCIALLIRTFIPVPYGPGKRRRKAIDEEPVSKGGGLK